jgi:hypothetical protein
MFEIPIFPYSCSSFIKLQLLADAHSMKKYKQCEEAVKIHAREHAVGNAGHIRRIH